jgi:hypothetical protein
MYYSAAGERGTIEARGLERQRKFDGLRKWKFDLIMQMFPLLLQLGLLLFASALCVYLWTIHLSLVIIVSSCTSFGFVSYVLLLVSAAVSPDSPFQTPLTPVVAQLIPKTLWTRATGSLNWLATPFRRSVHSISSACFVYIRTLWDVLPRLSKRNSPQEPTKINEATTLFDTPFPETSPEVPAVSWVLETSTDPHIITAAAEMVVDLQWPSTMNLRPQMTKLHDNILACFDTFPSTMRDSTSGRIRNGMSLRAIRLGRAYCALRCVHPSLGNSEPSFPPFPEDETVEPELSNLFRILEGKPNVILNADTSGATKWALHVIPSLGHGCSTPKLQDLKYFLDQFRPGIQNLDPTNFSNYLFCVNGFLSTPRSSDIVRMDKRSEMLQNHGHKHLIIFSLVNSSSEYNWLATCLRRLPQNSKPGKFPWIQQQLSLKPLVGWQEYPKNTSGTIYTQSTTTIANP